LQRFWLRAVQNRDFTFISGQSRRLLSDADAKRLHLAVKMAAFEAKQFCGVTDIISCFFNFFEYVFALVGIARLLQA
jgi:hypothetical protein